MHSLGDDILVADELAPLGLVLPQQPRERLGGARNDFGALFLETLLHAGIGENFG